MGKPHKLWKELQTMTATKQKSAAAESKGNPFAGRAVVVTV